MFICYLTLLLVNRQLMMQFHIPGFKYIIMNIFSTLSMCLHLFSAFSHEVDNPVHHGVFVIEDNEKSREEESFVTGWEGAGSWEDKIDRMLEESDESDTSKRWEDLARGMRRTYQTWKSLQPISDGVIFLRSILFISFWQSLFKMFKISIPSNFYSKHNSMQLWMSEQQGSFPIYYSRLATSSSFPQNETEKIKDINHQQERPVTGSGQWAGSHHHRVDSDYSQKLIEYHSQLEVQRYDRWRWVVVMVAIKSPPGLS